MYDLRYLVMRWDRRSVESRIRRQCLPPKLRDATAKATPPAFAITAVIPRYRDGGAFVKFVAPDPEATERAVSEFLREQRLKPWFSPSTRVRAFLVRGEPWLEDLHRCFPSTCLRVEFHQQKGAGGSGLPAMGPEALYALFRPYGRISDIAVNPGSKDGVPASAVIQFVRIRSATSARNCLHGLLATPPEMEAAKAGSKADRAARPDKAGGAERPGRAPREGAVLRITYERTTKTRWIGDWLAKHPRIVLPVLAAVLTATAVWVFDPIRTFFIRARITHSLHFADLGLTPYWGWLKATTVGRLPGLGSGPRGDGAEDPAALWDERKDAVERINSWLNECEETFIVNRVPLFFFWAPLTVSLSLSPPLFCAPFVPPSLPFGKLEGFLGRKAERKIEFARTLFLSLFFIPTPPHTHSHFFPVLPSSRTEEDGRPKYRDIVTDYLDCARAARIGQTRAGDGLGARRPQERAADRLQAHQ